MTSDYFKKEDRIEAAICNHFKLPHGKYLLLKHKNQQTANLVRKWIAFFMYKYTKRSYDDIGSIVGVNKQKCMDYIGEIGFKIKSEPQFQHDYNNINIHASNIYENESGKAWKAHQNCRC